ncbi:MAG: alpha/beta hydrolase [Pseudomonadales bacterium]
MSESITPPSGFHMMLEGRLFTEAMALMAQLPLLRMSLPHGTGPVMVLPGFMADDSLTWLLRRFLDGLGYRSYPWGRGVNRGMMLDHLPGIIESLEDVRRDWQATASLVGWSRGGVLSREVARDRPDLVRSVVTLGSPVRGGVRGTTIGRWVSRETGLTPEQMSRLLAERQQRPIETPITALYSKTDGVVSWQACIDEHSPHVRHDEVQGSHVGLVVNADVYRKVAAALAPYHDA